MIFGAGSQARESDAALFDTLFEQHRSAIFSFLLGRCGDRETAKDLLQETFVKVWRNIAEASRVPDSKKRFWIVAIARNVMIDWSRRVSIRPVTKHAVVDASGCAPSPILEAEANDTLERLDAAIKELPEDQRTVLVLSAIDGLTSTEIGEMLGIPAGTARFWLSEARKRLAQQVVEP